MWLWLLFLHTVYVKCFRYEMLDGAVAACAFQWGVIYIKSCSICFVYACICNAAFKSDNGNIF